MSRRGHKSVTIKTIRRGGGARLTMDFVADLQDDGTAPEIFASNIGRISRLAAGTVRVTYYSEHEAADGALERRIVCHVVLDLQAWADAQLLATEALRVMRSSPNGGRSNGPRGRTAQ